MASNENFSKRDAWLREESRLQREIQELNEALDILLKDENKNWNISNVSGNDDGFMFI